LDNRSLYLNFELMLAAADRGLIDQVTAMLENDFAAAEHTAANPAALPWYVRIGTVVARLFSPIL